MLSFSGRRIFNSLVTGEAATAETESSLLSDNGSVHTPEKTSPHLVTDAE